MSSAMGLIPRSPEKPGKDAERWNRKMSGRRFFRNPVLRHSFSAEEVVPRVLSFRNVGRGSPVAVAGVGGRISGPAEENNKRIDYFYCIYKKMR